MFISSLITDPLEESDHIIASCKIIWLSGMLLSLINVLWISEILSAIEKCRIVY